MDLAIRVNVRYAVPPHSIIRDALTLFKSPRWVQSIIRYIMPQLNSVSPTALQVIETLRKHATTRPHTRNTDEDASICVVCMESMCEDCVALPCQHWFHLHCIEPWLRMHSTCPTCRAQLPVDPFTSYSVCAINTTIILQESQANMPTTALLDLPASNQIIRAVVNARVRRNAPSSSQQALATRVATSGAMTVRLPLLLPSEHPVLNASIMQQGAEIPMPPQCLAEPIVPMLPRNAARRRFREDELLQHPNKRQRVNRTNAASADDHQVSASLS